MEPVKLKTKSFLPILFLCVGCQLLPSKDPEPPVATLKPAPVEQIVKASQQHSDFAIESRIEDLFRLNVDQFANLRVASSKGIVKLNGIAPEEWYKIRLLEVIRAMPGVRRVVDQVEIKAAGPVVTVPSVAAEKSESPFPWAVLQIAGVVILASTIIWAIRKRHPASAKESVRT